MDTKDIGMVTMDFDGTLHFRLRAESECGIIGDAQFIYRKKDPDYNKMLKHIGKISPGETKSVPSWE
jgi:hypothetical protein